MDDLPLTGGAFEVVEAGSWRAREAAVGAVSREGKSIGFVVSLGFEVFAGGDCFELLVDTARSAPAALATEAAVGAVNELRLAFLVGCEDAAAGDATDLGDVACFADDGVLGDFKLLADGRAGALVDRDASLPLGAGLPSGFLPLFAALAEFCSSFVAEASPDGSLATAASLPSVLRSSATGGNASPPLTAASLVGSAGCRSVGSSSAAVVGLSGLAAVYSSAALRATLADATFISKARDCIS